MSGLRSSVSATPRMSYSRKMAGLSIPIQSNETGKASPAFCSWPVIYNPLMAHVDKHAAGDFCWMELATTDQNAAKQFYSSLFGCVPNDMSMGPDGIYTIF